jgi:hypothetical protein
VGGFATKEVIDRALFNPAVIDPQFSKDHVAGLGEDPGLEVDEVWWEDMLVNWFEEPEEEIEAEEEDKEAEGSDSSAEADQSSKEKSQSDHQNTTS